MVIFMVIMLFVIMALALVCAIRDSMPAPHWVEEDELRRHGWYK